MTRSAGHGRRRRRAFVVLVIAAVGAGALWVWSAGGGDSADGPALRRIDTVAFVQSVNFDSGWDISGGVTSASARFTLDDGRILTAYAGTLADSDPLVPGCEDLATPGACVLLADLLGDAVVWFALVAADTVDGGMRLTLPGLVDMEDNGDLGVYANGWTLPLASPTRRECEGTDTTNLRQFITLFPPDRATSRLDLIADTVVAVTCTEQ